MVRKSIAPIADGSRNSQSFEDWAIVALVSQMLVFSSDPLPVPFGGFGGSVWWPRGRRVVAQRPFARQTALTTGGGGVLGLVARSREGVIDRERGGYQ